jgi:cell division protein FtsL
MSLAQTTAPEHRPQSRPASTQEERRRPDLRPLTAPTRARRRPRLGYAIIAVLGAMLIAAAQTALSAMTTQSTFELAELDAQQRELTLQSQQLYDEVAGLSSPQNLAERAAELGMVIDAAPSYLRLSDSAIVGGGVAAGEESTVNATEGGAVGNAFLGEQADREAAQAAEIEAQQEAASGEGAADETAQEEQGPQLPPAITEGLPSPITR